MFQESDYSILVSNIISGNNYKHCRLCLKRIHENFIMFNDITSLLLEDTNYTMSEILRNLLGDEICDEIPGIDAVCMDCANKSLQIAKFIKQCQDSTNTLNNIFDNLAKTLNFDIDLRENENLYIVFTEQESKIIFVKDENKKYKEDITRYFKCDFCEETFTNINEFKDHNDLLHDKFTCESCHDVCENISQLNEHKHSTKTYKCLECGTERCTKESYKMHLDKYHSDFTCNKCDKTFKGLKNMQKHELKHTVQYICTKCGKQYATEQFYLRHLKLCLENLLETHPMRSNIKKTYFCNICSKGYSTAGGLRVHNRFEHGNAKPHVCPHCNKHFTAPSYLKTHMIKHTGQKNFFCEICKRKFTSKEALIYHTRRHTGEKPYSCNLCDEKFVNASARAEHIKFKHIGPTLMCEICSRKFVTLTFLRQHIKKHHDPSNKLYTGKSDLDPLNVQ